MSKDKALRDELVFLLAKGNAHMSFADAVADFPEETINSLFPNGTYTPWALLEHIRITQKDIVDFIQNADYQEKSWPLDYWPKTKTLATKEDWENTLKHVEQDNKSLQKIINDPKNDLYTKIPHGTGQTLLREALVVADHNAYHLGEFAIMRQVMETWPKSHK